MTARSAMTETCLEQKAHLGKFRDRFDQYARAQEPNAPPPVHPYVVTSRIRDGTTRDSGKRMKNQADQIEAEAAATLLERMIRDIYGDKGSSAVQPLQWSILRYLRKTSADRNELRWIARYLGLTRAPVARALKTLESRGYVEQAISPADNRTKTVSLTVEGREKLNEDPIKVIADRILSLPKAEKLQFIRSIRTISLNLKSAPDDSNSKDPPGGG